MQHDDCILVCEKLGEFGRQWDMARNVNTNL